MGCIPVSGCETRVVPFSDLSQVNAGQGFGCEVDVLAKALQVVDGNDGAENYRKRYEALMAFRHHFAGQRHFGSARIYLTFCQQPNPLRRPNRVVADANVEMTLLKQLEPQPIKGCRECGARTLQRSLGFR